MADSTPVFPTSSSTPQSERSLPSSVSSTSYLARQTEDYYESLSAAYLKLSTLPNELSSETTVVSAENVNTIRQRLLELLGHASYDPASAKWTHVARTLRMISTSRRYVGVAPGVHMGEKEAAYGNYSFVLPESQEEWENCERRWESRSLGNAPGDGKTSKYFPNQLTSADLYVEEASTKAEQLRNKVKQWQATLVPGTQNCTPKSNEPSLVATISKGKEKELAQRQSPLPFPVVKHVAQAKASAAGPRSAQLANALKSSRNGAKLSSPPALPASIAVGIEDISEMSYLPPSFPAQLPTSTPREEREKVSQHRAKPPPIPRAFPSPSLSPRLPQSQLERIEVPLTSSLSLPNVTTPQLPVKRSITPPLDVAVKSGGSRPKKARTQAYANGEPATPNRLTTSSSPPPITSHTPIPACSTGKGLGNAKGLPVPVSSTPYRPNLPTLTELLASSRRSKPRPRPPSRKSKSRGTTPTADIVPKEKDELPVLVERQPARESSPALTAPRTMLSSPASGSSSSSRASTPHRPRSPISPLFTQNLTAFAPPFTSTQPDAGRNSSGPIDRRSSGVIGLGYNSQFDVEGQVGLVSDLLERDVHFDEWIRDVPEVEADRS